MLLSAYETSMCVSSNKGLYNNFIIGAEYKELLSLGKIINAVKQLCLKYPQFSLAVSKDYHSEFINEYDLKNCIDIVNDSSIEEILQKYTDLKFNYADKVPLWRVVLDSKTNTLFFVVDHTYFDGTAGKTFHVEFCKVLGDDDIVEDSIIRPKFESYPTSTEMMGFQDRFVGSGIIDKGTYPKMDERLMNSPYFKHNYQVVHLSKEKTDNLVKLARDNGFKLTGLMYSIASKAIVDSYEDKENKKIRTMIAINSRFKVGSQIDPLFYKFGLFYGTYFHINDISFIKNSEIIEIGKDFQKGLNENKDKCMEDCEVLETKAKNDRSIIEQSQDDMASRDSCPLTTLTISNLGVLNDNKVSKVYFDQPMIDSAFALHLISSNDCIALNFTSHRAIPNEIYNTYISNVLKFINSI